jgi:tetratricopeptide (TPR) repeat protein
LGKTKDALEIYNDGIKKFPDEYLLHFNKGLTLQKMENYSDALLSYENSLKLKPLHASSNLYTGMIIQKQNRIPALLAYATFLAIEPNTKRSKDGFDRISQVIAGNTKKEGNNVSIFLDPSTLGGKNKDKENDFSSVDLMFTLLSVSDNKNAFDSIAPIPADKLSVKIQLLINALSASKKDGKGFYWEHYVPFFIAMKEKNHVSTLAHLIYKPAMEEDNDRWLEKNDKAIDDFYDWLKGYKWDK